MKNIGIIGGGASAILTALNCWKQLGTSACIYVFEPSQTLGYGKAYATQGTDYILNVPANNMHIYQDGSDNFERWVLERDPTLLLSKTWPFVPRHYFGQYIEEHLSNIPKAHLHHIQNRVVSVSQNKGLYSLSLDDNSSKDIDFLVVATGYADKPLSLKYDKEQPGLKNKVFETAELKSKSAFEFSGNVLIVGTGLTALDIWRKLRKNPELKISMLSRHGFLPLSKEMLEEKIKLPLLCGMSPLQIFQVLRSIQMFNNLKWTVIADHVRPQIQKIWTCWTDHEKAQFQRHLKPFWEVIRHQIPSSVYNEIQADILAEKTKIYAGHIQNIKHENNECLIEYTGRSSDEKKTFTTSAIVFAMGYPIATNLLNPKNVPGIRPCPHGFGYINVSAPRLWLVGPAAKGMYNEIVAIPEIRAQAAAVAIEISKCKAKKKPSFSLERLCVHPTAAGENYFVHLKHALSFAMFALKIFCYTLVHAFLPFLYTDKTSNCLRDLSAVLSKRRQRTSCNNKHVENINPDADLKEALIHQNHATSLHHQNHPQTDRL